MHYSSYYSTQLRFSRQDVARFVHSPRLLFTFGLLLCLTWQIVLTVLMLTNYQGNLKDANGKPLNTTINLTFSLYDVPAWGMSLWTETHPSVTVNSNSERIT